MRLRTDIVVLLAVVLPMTGWAVDDPHGATDVIYCEQCHIGHNSLGDILINATDSLVTTLCLSCHTPGGWASMTKTMSTSQKAVPGTSGTSHAYDVPAVNAARGASLPTSPALLDHITDDDRISCATCHDPHSNTNPPFLRLDNSANALCLDCHASRNSSSVRTWTGSDLSHPVGVALPSTAEYHNPPLDVNGNPQPSDGNTTNDFVLLGGTNVGCTSCHGIHYTDSDSSTPDGP
jgi:predicted CXXCH cytochrome family protein